MNTPSASATLTTDTLKKDVRTLADDTVKVARQHLVDPAIEAAHRASAYARDTMLETRNRVSEQVTQVEHYASEQYDRTARWVSANPLTAVGIAFAVGLSISGLFAHSSKR
ncbi:hypothetical protein [Prosthecobacter sp.]|uniref:DUF883 family protein n=1 Tax=Prosthecobacter sp. TaxID=1965333 RepID=UPI002ABABB10|nr:hypothetical protein [Prosthecobacter sp.]MDZ4401179.1 hypothetical protein [Prosthecobacter sp.]